MVKRYVAEPGSDLVGDTMDHAEGWFVCRVAFVETVRAVGLVSGRAAIKTVLDEWPAFEVIEIDQRLAEYAAELAISRELRSLDAMHLAACLALPKKDLLMTTWDRRLHAAACQEGLQVIPETISTA